jgi:hypothetical protein
MEVFQGHLGPRMNLVLDDLANAIPAEGTRLPGALGLQTSQTCRAMLTADTAETEEGSKPMPTRLPTLGEAMSGMCRKRLRTTSRPVDSSNRGPLGDLAHSTYPDAMVWHEAKLMCRPFRAVGRSSGTSCFGGSQRDRANQSRDPCETSKSRLDPDLAGLMQVPQLG